MSRLYFEKLDALFVLKIARLHLSTIDIVMYVCIFFLPTVPQRHYMSL